MDTRQVSMEELVVLAEDRGARGGAALATGAKSYMEGCKCCLHFFAPRGHKQ